MEYQNWLGGACRIHGAAQPGPAAAGQLEEPHLLQGVRVAFVAAAHIEGTEGTADRDIAVGQPALEPGDDDRDDPNLLGNPAVVLR
jgi:hypothetical protein